MKQGWVYKKLGDVAEISAGQGAPQGEQNYCSNGTPFIKAGNLEDLVNGIDENSVQKVSQEVAQKHKLKLYKAGSVLFAKSGMSCMKGYVYTLKKDCYVVSHLAIIYPKSVNSNFLNYYLRQAKTYSLVKDAAYPSISLSDIALFPVPVPPVEEQKAICSLLDKLNRVIEAKKEQLKELDNLAQAIFYDMFGDPMENSKGWSMAILKDIVHKDCPISYGIVQPEDDVEDGIPIVRPVDFRDTVFVRNIGLKKTARSISDSYKRTILRGDEILFCVRGTTGTMGIATEELKGGNVTRGIVPLFFSNRMNRAFVYYSLKCPSTQSIIQEHTNGIALRQINIKDLRELPIITPPLDLQQAFAEKVEAIEQQKELINQSIKDVQTLFDAKMDYYFGE